LNGEVFEIIDDNGQLVVVGDDYREDITAYVASETGLPVAALPGVMDGLFESIMNDVYVKNNTIQSISAAEAYILGSGGAGNSIEGSLENEN